MFGLRINSLLHDNGCNVPKLTRQLGLPLFPCNLKLSFLQNLAKENLTRKTTYCNLYPKDIQILISTKQKIGPFAHL